MPGRLEGKVAFITGTAGGQGRAAALLFAAEGARVVGCDVKVDEAADTAEIVRAAGGVAAPDRARWRGDRQHVVRVGDPRHGDDGPGGARRRQGGARLADGPA